MQDKDQKHSDFFDTVGSKEFFLSFLVLAVISILGFFSYYQILYAKNEYQTISKQLEQSGLSIKESMAYGDFEKSMRSMDDLKLEIVSAKKLAQSLGQDIKYFQLIGLNSGFSKKETLLDLAYDVANFSDYSKSEIMAINNGKIFNSNGNIVDIGLLREKGIKLLPQLQKKLDKISKILSTTREDNIDFISSNLSLIQTQLDTTTKIINDDLSWLSGGEGEKNIMIIFQNNSELRGGSGGSLGSFGIANFKGGKLAQIDFGQNIYKLDSTFLEKEKIPAPSELEAFNNGNWSMKQAGFAVDGPEALAKIAWFYNRESGKTVDGVITIDTDAFGSLLKLIGSISMPEYNITLTPDNYKLELEREVQVDYFKRDGGKEENEPKRVIGEIMPKFMAELIRKTSNEKDLIELASTISDAIKQKQILFYFNQPDFQSRLEKINVAGKVYDFNGDYLNINNSNLAGAKSSQNIRQTVDLDVVINDTGTMQNNLTLTRTHTGKNEWPDGLDRNYVRMLLPKGSEVTNFEARAGNFQRYYDRGYKNGKPYWTDEEAGKSTVNFWMSSMPGEASSSHIEYKPNYQVKTNQDFTYRLMIQKQPGAPVGDIKIALHYPSGFRPINVKNFDLEKKLIILKFPVERDQIIEVAFDSKDS